MIHDNLPKHTIIENDLLKKIKDGIYQPNTLIPKEMDLMKYYGVSRPTVRQAIQSLVEKGLVEKRKKRGTIVKQNKISQEFTHVIESYNDEAISKGLTPKTQVLLSKEEPADLEVAQQLRIKEHESVQKLIRLRYSNDEPIVLVTSYIPTKCIPNFLKHNFNDISLYQVLEDNGYKVESVHRKLEVLSADETTADLLNIAEDSPIFYFHTTGSTTGNTPVEYSIAKYRGDINYFEIDLKR